MTTTMLSAETFMLNLHISALEAPNVIVYDSSLNISFCKKLVVQSLTIHMESKFQFVVLLFEREV